VQHLKKQLIVIEGPTASGKTALGVFLAKHWSTVVLSADSRQFYKELSIGTAKPTEQEQEGVKHYFVDSHLLIEQVSSGQYAKEAFSILEHEFEKHDRILLVGGSGMFIDALCVGLDEIPTSETVRNEITEEWRKDGIQPLLEELALKDPVFYREVDRDNPMRVIRAIEAIRVSGYTFSELRTRIAKDLFFEVKRFVIEHDRELLYQRINQRVDRMMQQGLLEEVRSVKSFRHLSPLNTVGYTELFNFLEGSGDLDAAVELIKRNTRRYAKRQLTWFRRHKEAIWIPFDSIAEMSKKIENWLNYDDK
jgi:tRNA dimethylallyltransferase